jgi:hypothetical protein
LPPIRRQLDALIADAITDAHDDSEQRMGFYTMIDNYLALPFETEVLGAPVIGESIELCAAEQIVAICRRGATRQKIGILNLPLPKPAPAGAEWIEAYRRWTTGRG